MKQYLKVAVQNLTLLGISVVVCILLLEGVGRITGLIAAPIDRFQFDPSKGYELAPGAPEINSLGFRDREYTVDKPENTFRVLVIGDSFTFGDGVSPEEAYPSLLEEMLNEELGTESLAFEVLNAGVPGYNTIVEAIHLEQLAPAVEPDLVLVGFVLNDAEIGIAQVRDPSLGVPLWVRGKEWAKAHFGLYAAIREPLKSVVSRRASPDVLDLPHDNPSIAPLSLAARGESNVGFDRCEEGLAAMASLASDRGIPIMLAVFPVLSGLEGEYAFGLEHQLVTEVAEDQGFKVLDLLPTFSGRDSRSLWVSSTDKHPNPEGHAIAAEQIYRTMIAESLVPPARLVGGS